MFPKSDNKYTHDMVLELRFDIESNLEYGQIIQVLERMNALDLCLWLAMKANAKEMSQDTIISTCDVLSTVHKK